MKYFLMIATAVKTHVNITDVCNIDKSIRFANQSKHTFNGKFITTATPVSKTASNQARQLFNFIPLIYQTSLFVLVHLVWTFSSLPTHKISQ